MSKGLIEALEAATQDDLATLDAEIASLRKQAESLAMVRRIVAAKFGIKPDPAQSHAAKPKPAAVDSRERPPGVMKQGAFSAYRIAAAKHLLHAGVPVKPSTLAADNNIPLGSTTAVFDHPWFDRSPDGVTLTREGQKAVGSTQ